MKRGITIVISPRPDQSAQPYAWAVTSDLCHPETMNIPRCDLIRLPGHWYNNTRALQGRHGDRHRVRKSVEGPSQPDTWRLWG